MNLKGIFYLRAFWDWRIVIIYLHPWVFYHTPNPIPMFGAFLKHAFQEGASFATHCLLLAVFRWKIELGWRNRLLEWRRLSCFERKASKEHSVKYDSEWPYVDLGVSLTVSFGNHFRRSVAQSTYMGDLSLKGIKNSSYAKIYNFDQSCFFVLIFSSLPISKDNIFKLQISMNYSLFVAVVNSLKQLE